MIDLINSRPPKPNFEGDPFEQAERLMDLLFPFISTHERFMFLKIIRNSDISTEDKKLAHLLESQIDKVMLNFNYIEIPSSANQTRVLTPLGREVKEAGGHKKYFKKKNRRTPNPMAKIIVQIIVGLFIAIIAGLIIYWLTK